MEWEFGSCGNTPLWPYLIEKAKLVCSNLKHKIIYFYGQVCCKDMVHALWFKFVKLISTGILQNINDLDIYWYFPLILTTNYWVTSIWKLRQLVTWSLQWNEQLKYSEYNLLSVKLKLRKGQPQYHSPWLHQLKEENYIDLKQQKNLDTHLRCIKWVANKVCSYFM